MHPATDRYARLFRAVETIGHLAEQVTSDAIDSLLAHPLTHTHIDDTTLNALRGTSDAITTLRRALTALLEAAAAPTDETLDAPASKGSKSHQLVKAPEPAGPKVIDAAEAWRRAHLHLPAGSEHPIVFHIQELEEVYRALPVIVELPAPDPIPTIESATTFLIDKSTGAVTLWPLLPTQTIAHEYRRYRQSGHPGLGINIWPLNHECLNL